MCFSLASSSLCFAMWVVPWQTSRGVKCCSKQAGQSDPLAVSAPTFFVCFTRFLDPEWWSKGASRKEDSEMFRELTFRLGFLMQVRACVGAPRIRKSGGRGRGCTRVFKTHAVVVGPLTSHQPRHATGPRLTGMNQKLVIIRTFAVPNLEGRGGAYSDFSCLCYQISDHERKGGGGGDRPLDFGG